MPRTLVLQLVRTSSTIASSSISLNNSSTCANNYTPLRRLETRLKPSPEASLGDKLQWLAVERPIAMRVIAQLVDRLVAEDAVTMMQSGQVR